MQKNSAGSGRVAQDLLAALRPAEVNVGCVLFPEVSQLSGLCSVCHSSMCFIIDKVHC